MRGYNIIIILYLINICSLSLFIPTPCLSSAPCLSPLSMCPLLPVYHVSLGVCLSLPWWKSGLIVSEQVSNVNLFYPLLPVCPLTLCIPCSLFILSPCLSPPLTMLPVYLPSLHPLFLSYSLSMCIFRSLFILSSCISPAPCLYPASCVSPPPVCPLPFPSPVRCLLLSPCLLCPLDYLLLPVYPIPLSYTIYLYVQSPQSINPLPRLYSALSTHCKNLFLSKHIIIRLKI